MNAENTSKVFVPDSGHIWPRQKMLSSTGRAGVPTYNRGFTQGALGMLAALAVCYLAFAGNVVSLTTEGFTTLVVALVAMVATKLVVDHFLSKKVTLEMVTLTPSYIEVKRRHIEDDRPVGLIYPGMGMGKLVETLSIYEVDSWEETRDKIRVRGIICRTKGDIEDIHGLRYEVGLNPEESTEEVRKHQRWVHEVCLSRSTSNLSRLKECLRIFEEAKKQGKKPDEGIHRLMDRLDAEEESRWRLLGYEELGDLLGGSDKPEDSGD